MHSLLSDVFVETWRGKTLPRILLNRALRAEVGALRGRVLDLAGGKSSYERFLDFSAARVETTNIDPARSPTHVHDLRDPLPMEDDAYDAVLLLNALYILRDPSPILREAHRVLKPGGRLVVSSPFCFNVAPEPDDFVRYTPQGLEALLKDAGFAACRIVPVGGRAVAAEALLDAAYAFYPLRACMRLWALFKDRAVYARLDRAHPAPPLFLASCTR